MLYMNEPFYNKNNPFFASIKERYSLCKPGSHKATYHIVLDLKNSALTYTVGDSIAITPENDPLLVEKIIQVMHATGKEIITDKNHKEWSFDEFLKVRANISDVSRKLLSEFTLRQTNAEKKSALEILQQGDHKEELKIFLSTHHLLDLLSEHPETHFEPQELSQLLMPLLPRFYSISSSMAAVGNEVHLTIALLKYTHKGILRSGVCTQYLCEHAPMDQPLIPVYIQSHHGFTLPIDDVPIIMIGPGTGIAPFRAFMQERLVKKAPGDNWLFFGECNRSTNFFYENFWSELVNEGKLRLDAAFSRDQAHKVYVQHRMLEQGAELLQWLNKGAHLYVCGDAQHMAKDVENTLLQIFQHHGGKSEAEAKIYLKALRTEKRYLRDVY